jgi:hypothetical protein
MSFGQGSESTNYALGPVADLDYTSQPTMNLKKNSVFKLNFY